MRRRLGLAVFGEGHQRRGKKTAGRELRWCGGACRYLDFLGLAYVAESFFLFD